jgi:hypothetical protein
MVFTALPNGARTQMKKFSVTFVVEMDEENNILSSFDDNHEEDVYDLITNVMYDVDDVKIDNLVVKERA